MNILYSWFLFCENFTQFVNEQIAIQLSCNAVHLAISYLLDVLALSAPLQGGHATWTRAENQFFFVVKEKTGRSSATGTLECTIQTYYTTIAHNFIY